MIIEITSPGVYGNGPIAVGTKLEVATEPTAWSGKYRVVSESEGKSLEVATPSSGKRRGRPRKAKAEDAATEQDDEQATTDNNED